MAKKKTPYERLGVEKDADVPTIKKAHRKRAMETHPDRGGNKEEFDEMQSAYLVLVDPQRKKVYDETGAEDEPKEVPLHAILRGLLVESLSKIGDPGNFKKRDVVGMMLASARENLMKASNDHLSAKKVIEALGDAMKRLKDPKGVLAEMVKRQRDMEASRLPGLVEQERVFSEAVLYLEECRYNAEKQKYDERVSTGWSTFTPVKW